MDQTVERRLAISGFDEMTTKCDEVGASLFSRWVN